MTQPVPQIAIQLIRNQKGQTAIFVALIFQVLFLLFAMAINVALVVHDKINLQNAVDLASYYAAQRQAEILNAIAHQNYGIRQSWKLLAWRYRVLGTMGLTNPNHPTRTQNLNEELFPPAGYDPPPAVCVSYRPTWQEVAEGENLCRVRNQHIPPLPVVTPIAGFLGINHSIAQLSEYLREQYQQACAFHGAFNWWFAMSALTAFRFDQHNRRMVINALANNLSARPDADFIDLDGNSVLLGARKTFEKNLTFANRQSTVSFELFNSLQGIPREQWLPSILVSPTLLFTDSRDTDGCQAELRHIKDLPLRRQVAQNFLLNAPPNGLGAGPLVTWAQEMFLEDEFQFALGVEKNPWFVAYVGVRAETAPRQIFFPIMGNITMRARAYSKPFGGRIGPWHGSQWPRGAPHSTGNQVDPLVPGRTLAGGLLDSDNDYQRLPNYARYPGDVLGLSSSLAQAALQGLGHPSVRFHFAHYHNVAASMGPGQANDVLSWNWQAGEAPPSRYYELAAISPDLFDITYYSIDANFGQDYALRIEANKGALGIPATVPVRGDLGHHQPQILSFSVKQQIETTEIAQLKKQEAFYFIRDRHHLLTSWVPGLVAYEYSEIPDQLFGRCQLPDDEMSVSTPGSCVAGGGRTGYSVKLISRDALFSELYQIGGGGAPPGPIQNPPPEGW